VSRLSGTNEGLLEENRLLKRKIRELEQRKTGGDRAEDVLLESEIEYRALIENSLAGVYIYQDGVFRFANRRFCEIYGYTAEELVDKLGPSDLIPLEERDIVEGATERCFSGKKDRLTHRAVKKDGTAITVAVLGSPIAYKGRPALSGTALDITEQERAAEALRESEKTLRSLINATQEALLLVDTGGKVLVANEVLAQKLGRDLAEIVGTCQYDYFPGKVREYRKAQYDTVVRTGSPVRFEDERNGRLFESFAYPVFDEQGKVSKIAIFAADITARRSAEEELRKSEEKYRELVENANSIILRRDREGRVTFFNEFSQGFFGYMKEEILGKNVVGTIVPEYESTGRDLKWLMEDMGRNPDLYVSNVNENIRHDGERVWVAWTNRPVYDSRGHVAELLCIGNDITALRKAEETLREYEKAVEGSQDIIVTMDRGYRYLLANAAFLKCTGLSQDKVVGRPVAEVVGSDFFRNVIKPNLDRCFQGELVRYEGKRTFLGLGERNLLISYFPVAGPHGIDRVVALIRDVTEQRRVEAALRLSEEKYRSIFENAFEGLFQTTPDGRYISANPALAAIYGYDSPREMIDAVTDIQRQQYVNPEDREVLRNLFDGQGFVERFETQLYRKDGERVWISMTARAVRSENGEITHYEGSIEDITSRKQADRDRMAAHRRVLDIIEFLPDATFVIDHERKVVAWNRAMEEMTGLRKKEILGKGDYAYAIPFYGEARPMLIDLIFEGSEENIRRYDYMEKQGDTYLAEVCVPMIREGEGAYLSGRASPLFDPSGSIIGAIESLRDITEQKRITEELLESEERYRTAIENSSDAVAMIKGREHLYVNRKFLEMFGFDNSGQVLNQPVGLITHPDDRERVVEMNRRRQQNEKIPQQYEFKGIKTNGDLVFVECSAIRTTYKGDPITLVYLRDVTVRKQLEAQLLHSQKMEAVGTLAGGVAHDFNNILTAIIGYGSLLQAGMGNDPKRQYVDQILASSQKAAVLTQSLLAFSRKQVIELKPGKINEIVREAEKLLKRLLTEDIEFTVTLADPDMTVEADVTQIDQVLMNLAANARDAMPTGGKLTIETKAVHVDNRFGEPHGFSEPGDYVLISVSDTGAGMDRKTREKIFEPFFTTKEVGKGTGLGLSIVYGIVKQHNGYITVSSRPCEGTTFNVYLPLSKTQTRRVDKVREYIGGGSETILIAEDNHDVRRLAKEILTHQGYTVIEAVDGDDAVRRFMDHRHEIALLLFDVVMPGKNGREAYEEIRRLRPDVKVLFTSGYTGDVVLNKGINDEAINYISKPLTPNELLRKVREVVEK